MTILAAPTKPTNLLNNRPILTLLSPALSSSLYLATIFQRLLSTTTLFLFLRAYILSLLLLRQSYYISQVLLLQSYYASSLLAKNGYWASKEGIQKSWKATEKLRKKLFFELAVFVLGGGNGVILIVFWPGWIFVGGGVWGVWMICG
ncbi:hypothetical protein LSUE1_G010255 [Lachnellula suecica]|uniref:Uncharacterized protein n=1 Tax=Lachnellula suecica TaxID=602035 RepID=A0A8T9BUK1_9HELO|nr:hypothetical protein LSUE1_G010255 [Lachnellula suecica]